MELLVDVGNTRAKFSICSAKEFGNILYIDNEALSSKYLLETFSGISLCIVSNVSQPQISEIIRQWSALANVKLKFVRSEKQKNGVKAGYKDVSQMGVDRWLAILGANYLMPNKNLIIVDSGTATTIDILTSSGEHQGGWILPGIKTMIDSLSLKTERVKAKVNSVEQLSFGQTTDDCVNNATWAATIGLVSEAKRILNKTGNILDDILVTGGNAKQLIHHSSMKLNHSPDIIFYGLLQYTREI